jgi:hypothetical protein
MRTAKREGTLTKFNCTDIYGKQIEIATPTLDKLTETLNGDALDAEKEVAARILKWVAQQEKEAADLPEIDRAAAFMLTEMNADSLVRWPDRYQLKMVTGLDGVTREAFTIEESKPLAPATAPAVPTAQTFEPTVKLPVLEPSETEKQAIAGLRFDLDARFSPKAIAERVAAIEADAARLREARDQIL